MADILHTFSRYTYVIHYVDVIPPDLHSEVYEKLRRHSNQLYLDMSLIPAVFLIFPTLVKYFPYRKKKWFIKVPGI
jgi:hypothetical protein